MSDGPSDDHPSKVVRLHPPGRPHHPSLDRAVQGQIGAQLRQMYEALLQQPIPDRLLDLVHRLGGVENPSSSGETLEPKP